MIGDTGFKAAVYDFTKRLYHGEQFPLEFVNAGLFSYVLTKKQKGRIKKICLDNGWPVNNSQGITVYISDMKHVINARTRKDNSSWEDCAAIMFVAYCRKSEIALNTGHANQTFILNSKEQIFIQGTNKYGAVILEVSKNNLAQVTSYDAHRAKVHSILGR